MPGKPTSRLPASMPMAKALGPSRRETPGLQSGLNSLGGNSRHTGHLMQAGRAPFSVNLLSGSACFHGDLTSEIFHLGCQMPVDEAKPPRVTKYRQGPTGSRGQASSVFGWEPRPPRGRSLLLELPMLGLLAEVRLYLSFLWAAPHSAAAGARYL